MLPYCNSQLSYGVNQDNKELVESLLHQKADPNYIIKDIYQGGSGLSVLMRATQKRNFTIIKILLDYGALVDFAVRNPMCQNRFPYLTAIDCCWLEAACRNILPKNQEALFEASLILIDAGAEPCERIKTSEVFQTFAHTQVKAFKPELENLFNEAHLLNILWKLHSHSYPNAIKKLRNWLTPQQFPLEI